PLTHVRINEGRRLGMGGGTSDRGRRLFLFLAGALLVSSLTVSGGCFPALSMDVQTKPGFVGREGTHFVLDGKPLFVAGVNNHYLPFASPEEVRRVLDDAVQMGATVVRTFIQPVIGSLDGVSKPTIWDRRKRGQSSDLSVHGNYILYWDPAKNAMAINEGPNGMQRLDFLVAEAGKRKLKLIIAMLDFWDYTGGAQQMRAWYGSRDKNTFFFEDERTKADFKRLIGTVLLRTNSLTGVSYREDPTIFAWELMNEPNAKPDSLLHHWVEEMSAYVKSIDPNHLVASGHANVENGLADIDIPSIDSATWHAYPIYLGKTCSEMTAMIKEYCDVGATA